MFYHSYSYLRFNFRYIESDVGLRKGNSSKEKKKKQDVFKKHRDLSSTF